MRPVELECKQKMKNKTTTMTYCFNHRQKKNYKYHGVIVGCFLYFSAHFNESGPQSPKVNAFESEYR